MRVHEPFLAKHRAWVHTGLFLSWIPGTAIVAMFSAALGGLLFFVLIFATPILCNAIRIQKKEWQAASEAAVQQN